MHHAATATGPMNSTATATPRSTCEIASQNTMFIASVTSPRPAARVTRRGADTTHPGRVSATTTRPPNSVLSHPTTDGGACANSPTATAAPPYCATAPATNVGQTGAADNRFARSDAAWVTAPRAR